MSSIDERIVRLKFDNQAFEQGIARSRDSLGRFTKQLETPTSGKGIDNISTAITKVRDSLGRFASESQKDFGEVDNAGKKVSLEHIGNGVQAISDKFKALSVVGVAALATIASRAAYAGLNFAKSFTLTPITDGFHEYETNLNSIQTILANTQASGATLKDVEASLNDLNHYSDQTIYNFSEMAKNIGTFTAAGVDLETSAASIKGIANLAALSGSNSEQASGAMYQLSQAISSGRVSLEDWNSVVNAGMGGTVFQRALAQTAEKMGTLSDGAVKLSGKMKNVSINGKSFRESITAKPGQESWLTSKVLTSTLQQFTGDLSDAQLKAEGFSDAQIKAIQAQAKTAKEAATQVKTLTQLFDTTKEALGSGWAQTFQTIFGDFTEAKGLFTGVSDAVNKVISSSSHARNKMLSDWKELGGRDNLIKGITNGVKAFASVIKPIHDAFREIFPATTGKQLADLTKQFADFMSKLKIGSDTADKLKRTFAGVFAVFGILWDVVRGVIGVIFDLVGAVGEGAGGFLGFTAKIGDFLVALRNSIKQGEGLSKFFNGLGKVLAFPIRLIERFIALLGGATIATADLGGKGLGRVEERFHPLVKIGEAISAVWGRIKSFLPGVLKTVTPLVERFVGFMERLGKSIVDGLAHADFSHVLDAVNTGLFGGLLLLFKKFIDKGLSVSGIFNLNANGGIFDSLRDAFGGLTDTMSAMQTKLKADALLRIAAAIALLAGSVLVMSTIDSEKLGIATGAIGGLFAQLMTSMALFEKFGGLSGFAKMPFVAASMILLALAIDLLTISVKQLAELDWNGLAKGLVGVGALLGGVVGAVQLMPNPKGMISTGAGLLLLAGAIKILASAVQDLSGLSWEELGKGLTGVGGLLVGLTLFTKFAAADKGGLAQGAGILLLAAAIKILASAAKDFATMSWGEMAKGMVGMAGGLALIAGALYLIPPSAIVSAAGVLLVALSLGKVADALQQMGGMSWEEIGKGLTALAGALTLIAAALYVIPPTAVLGAAGVLIVAYSLQEIANVLQDMATMSWEEIGKSMTVLGGSLILIAGAVSIMTTALPGAAALLVVAASLAIIQPVLLAFGQMSWAEIGKGLLTLAAMFAVIGLSGLLLAPVIPLILGLGVAIALLGVGILAAGAGILLFATALSVMAAAGGAASAMIIGIVSGLIGLIPEVMKQIGLGLVAFAGVIATSGPAISQAIVAVLEALISAIERVTPKVVRMLLKMLTMMVQEMSKYLPRMVSAGLKLVTGILNGIADNIGKVISAAVRVVSAFLKGVSDNIPKVIQSGVNLILKFVNSLADAIRSNSAAMGRAGANLGTAIIEGMVRGLGSGLGTIVSKARSIASSALNAAKDALGIHSPSKEFEKVGNYVNDGFRKGLDGNKKQVYDAFNDLKKMLKDLSKNSKASYAERHKASAAYATLVKSLNDEKTAIGKLADKYDVLTDKIKKATDTYNAAVKTRNDYNKSVKDQYSDQATPTADITVAQYTENLKKQIEDTKKFSNTMQRLRVMGLNDELYKDLLAAGPSALPFADSLLAAGPEAVKNLKALAIQLNTAGAALGKQASTNLYQAAVDSAKGLVDGLKKEQANIEKQMDKIADAMVKSIKKKLGIKSPSRVMAEVGGYSAAGLVRGLGEMSGAVEKASADTGQAAVDSLRKSMAGFSDLITGPVDIRPVVTPVLDLSSVKKNAGQIGTMLGSQPISVDSSYSKAAAIANARLAAREATDSQSSDASSVTFNQYNNSPKALSSAEIYRQTNNQLSRAKGALATSANKS